MSEANFGYLLALTALLFFTSGILVAKAATSRLDLGLGFLVATTMNVLLSGLVFLLQLGLRPEALAWNSQAFWVFAAAGIFSTYFGRWFFYEAVVRFGPAKASIFQVSSPIFTALMAWSLLGESLSSGVMLGVVFAVGGLMLVSYKPGFSSRRIARDTDLDTDRNADDVKKATSGVLPQSILLLGLGSSLAYAIGNFLRGSAVRDWNEPVLGGFLGAASGLLLHLAFTPGKMQLLKRLKTANRKGVWLFALLGFFTISGQIFGIAAMRHIPLSIATLISLCTPVLVFPLSYLLFRTSDDFTPRVLVGTALTLLGIFIVVVR